MSAQPNLALLIAALLSSLAAVLHLGVILGGAPWYRFFGAGERMARMAEAGHWVPPLLTLAIAGLLFAWGACALMAGGWTTGLDGLRPWLKPALSLITAVYLLRGLAVVAVALWVPAQLSAFVVWSSLICLAYGLVHLAGLIQVWGRL